MNCVAEDVLEIFAEAAKPPSGRRHFDAEIGAPAFRDPAEPTDWAAYILARTERRGPDECWPWKGGARVTIEDNRGKRGPDGKRKQSKPSVALDYARLIFRETRGYLPKHFVFSTCGEQWCANPRHFSDDVKDRPKRKIIIMGKQGAIETRKLPAPQGTTVPIRAVENWHRDEKHTPETALTAIIGTLEALDDPGRRRVLAAVRAFYGLEVA